MECAITAPLPKISEIMEVISTIYKLNCSEETEEYINGLVQDCSNSSALPMELLQCFTKPSIYCICYNFSILSMAQVAEILFHGRQALQWGHNELDGFSNHQPHHCLLNRLLWHRSKKTSKLCVTGLCAGNYPHKEPVMQKMFPFDDVIMGFAYLRI